MIGPLLGAAFGAAFFVWVHGVAILDPTNVGWLMRSDWRFQFLGWQFFRQEAWQWPPGLILGYNRAPLGSAIGLTDSVPLVAFALKPWHAVLPMPFQYLGGWLLLCFALQGLFGALIVRVWSRSVWHQSAGGLMFVLLPTLLNRTVHAALCAHFLLLWVIWLYVKHRPGLRVPRVSLVCIGVLAGLVHPYLAGMVLALEAAFVMRVWIVEGWEKAAAVADAVALALVAVVAGWWASGLFSLPASTMAREGLTTFSMNILGPVSPNRWSALLPEQRIGAGGQGFEGYQYLGAGALALIGFATVVRIRGHRVVASGGPLALVCGVMAVYSLSPKVTWDGHVVVDYTMPWMERLSLFRVTGRFFWPSAYVLLAVALAWVVSHLRSGAAAVVVSFAIALQLVDLRPGLTVRRNDARSAGAGQWSYPFRSDLWRPILAHYKHLVLVQPAQCGASPVSFEMAGYLASLHGLSVNGGEQSRWDDDVNAAYCADFGRRLAEGAFTDDSLYMPGDADLPRLLDGGKLTCRVLDGKTICATPLSAAAWPSLPGPGDR